MALSSRDGLVQAMAGPNSYTGNFVKILAGGFVPVSAWAAAMMPGAGSLPAVQTPLTCDGSTPGALPIPTVSAGKTLYLTQLTVASTASLNTVSLYDRAGHWAWATGSGTYPVALSAPARLTSTVGYVPYIEVGAAAFPQNTTTFTLTYTNSAGVSGRTATCAPLGSSGWGANTFYPAILQAGDTGVNSIDTVTAFNTGTQAANYAVVLARPLLNVAAYALSAGVHRGATALTDIGTNPCLFLGGAVQTTQLFGSYSIAEG